MKYEQGRAVLDEYLASWKGKERSDTAAFIRGLLEIRDKIEDPGLKQCCMNQALAHVDLKKLQKMLREKQTTIDEIMGACVGLARAA